MEPQLRELASRLGLGKQVRFLGYCDAPEAALDRWDLFLLPSRYEGAPLALLEALAAGLVVIATRVAGVAGVIEPRWTVPVGDAEALAHAAARALSDWPRAVADAAAARQTAGRERSLQSQLERTEAAYRELVRGTPGAGQASDRAPSSPSEYPRSQPR
jgi:glycosyltransferase involved in cell wall biosynthesis